VVLRRSCIKKDIIIMLAPRKKLWSTPKSAMDTAAELAQLKPYDVVYDVGCGDGRVILHLATKQAEVEGGATPLTFVGIEIDEERAQVAKGIVHRAQSLLAGPGGDAPPRDINIDIQCANAMEIDYSNATVIFLYLIPRGLRLIQPLLIQAAQQKQSLIRIITYMSPFETKKGIGKDDSSITITLVKKVLCSVEHQPDAKWPVYLYHFDGRQHAASKTESH
jgi:SAM-dependent methyltransferase